MICCVCKALSQRASSSRHLGMRKPQDPRSFGQSAHLQTTSRTLTAVTSSLVLLNRTVPPSFLPKDFLKKRLKTPRNGYGDAVTSSIRYINRYFHQKSMKGSGFGGSGRPAAKHDHIRRQSLSKKVRPGSSTSGWDRKRWMPTGSQSCKPISSNSQHP